MTPLPDGVLDVVLLNLQRYVAPQVTTEDGQLTLMMVAYVLAFLHVEETELPALQAERFAALKPVLQDLLSALRATDAPAGLIADAQVAAASALARPQEAEATDRAFQAALRATERTAAPWLAGFAKIQTAYVEKLTDAMEHWAYGQAAREHVEQGQRQLTPDLLTPYLCEHLPEHPAIAAAEVMEIAGGFAKKTYKLKVEGGPDGWSSLIVRQDAVGGPTPLSCIDEVGVLRLAEKHGLPVASVRWVEPSAALDAPFLFADRKPGVCSFDAWRTPGPDGRLPGEELAVQVARLHAIPLSELPGGAPASVAETLWAYIDGFEQRWQRDRPNVDPLVQLGFDWLKRNIPTDIEQLTIVHADISERNVLVDEGRLSAILDWELWHIGDPMYDLAYIRPFLERSMDWSRFIDIYKDSGGRPVSAANDDYWFIFSEFRNAAMLASGLRTFVDGRNRGLKTIGPVLGQYRNRIRLAMRRLLPLLERPAS
jgi:aminoglycoside phosphotransferase (APT) family kinase protein